jgi:shikimate dehydrogenase
VLPTDARLPQAALLVNASPLGMVGQDPLEIDLAPLPEHALVYDLVYAPIETALLKAARARGLEAVDGLEMLVGQAAIAFELFFGSAPPQDGEDELRARLLA